MSCIFSLRADRSVGVSQSGPQGSAPLSRLTCDKCWPIPPPHLLTSYPSLPPLPLTAHSRRVGGFSSVVSGCHGALAIKCVVKSVSALCCFSMTSWPSLTFKTSVHLMSPQNPKYVLSVVVPYNFINASMFLQLTPASAMLLCRFDAFLQI